MSTERDIINRQKQGFKTFSESNLNQNSAFSFSLYNSNIASSRQLHEHSEIDSQIKKHSLKISEEIFIKTSSNEVNKRSIIKLKFKAKNQIKKAINLAYLFDFEEFLEYSSQENAKIVSADEQFENLNFKAQTTNEE